MVKLQEIKERVRNERKMEYEAQVAKAINLLEPVTEDVESEIYWLLVNRKPSYNIETLKNMLLTEGVSEAIAIEALKRFFGVKEIHHSEDRGSYIFL